jgi:hypothetical protein
MGCFILIAHSNTLANKSYSLLRLPTRQSNLLVTKLTTVPKIAIKAVCSTSPKEKLAQIEHSVPPIVPIRISFHFILNLLFFL